ncbi:sulfatase-like hydrolase/transferase [Sphingopyxis macrogoltabida]|uniref:Sulfatase n=1 Tax=Sphingopyxis macrogoltabida TaxID=33050 RepID=A0AAC8YZ18_SPHMC|nr:sulfatase-like hydrolase/transferase [Sphingopyxis macrogoltabida]ALJ13651.1 sulfatase [Sphingopyxis macrogoltabida]AMU88905.1 sulfatase [Sphingopyxis macrogoltabida]
MKKRWFALGALVLAGAGGYWAFEANKYRLPGIVQDWRDPVQANRPVAWQQGPASAPADPSGGKRPPNIILIVADDLGYNDVSLNGGGLAGGIIKTPNIDAIAREGLNFTTAYAANATCSPSRAAMMTGRYPTRFGFEYTAVPVEFAENLSHGGGLGPLKPIFHRELITPDIPDYPDMGVPASEVTIAEAVKAAGYHTLHIGKWHLGEAPALQPQRQGFDESLAVLGGAAMFLPEDDADVVNAKLPWDAIDRFLWANLRHAVSFNGSKRFHPKGHMTDYFADEAIKAIDANRGRPFFMYLAFNAPHTPLQATKEDYAKLPQIKDHKTRVYGAMIAQLDRRIGDVMAKLKEAGIDDNTLVIFTSDNGGAWYNGMAGLNAPFRGWKATFFEGGIRTPFFMRWPGHIAPGTQRGDVTGHIDLFATIAAAAGAAVPADRQVDSENILAGPAKRQAMYWRSGDYRAVRMGDWKLQVTKRPEKARLYNLAADPTEKHDLAASEPQRVAALRAMIEAQNKGMAKPIWPGLVEGPIRIDVPLNAPWQDGQDYIYWTN